MSTSEKNEPEDEPADDGSVLKLIVQKLASQALLFGTAGLVVLVGAWKISNGSLPLVLSILFVFVVALGSYLFFEQKGRAKKHAPAASRSASEKSQPVDSPTNGFKVDLWTAPLPHDGGRDVAVKSKNKKASYRTGQKIVVGFRASQNCYLTLLNIGTSGKLTVLFPNAHHSENFVQAGREYRIPESDSEFEYELQGPIGTEKLKAVATLKKVALLESHFALDGSLFRTVDATTGARDIRVIEKKISSVPRTEWTEDTCEFLVT
ncbi:MAG: DUF4384 domain-containing protein [Nibricoccus sp.]